MDITKNIKLSDKDLISELAFNICSEVKGHIKSQLKNELLKIKRANLIDDIDGSYKGYRKRGLYTSNEYKEIVSVLSCEEPRVKKAVIQNIAVVTLLGLLEGMTHVEKDEKEDSIEVQITSVEWAGIRSMWFLYIAYLRRTPQSELIDIISEVNGSEELLKAMSKIYDEQYEWFLSPGKDDKRDVQMIATYQNKSEFFRTCMKVIPAVVIDGYDDIIFFVNSAENNAHKGFVMEGFMDDVESMKNYFNDLKDREWRRSVLNPNRDDLPPIDVSEYIMAYMTEELQMASFEFAMMGIDLMTVLRLSDITKQAVQKDIKTGFFFHEQLKGECSYMSKSDQEAVLSHIVRLLIADIFSMKVDEYLTDNVEVINADEDVKALMADLKGENERLERMLSKEKQKTEQAEKKNSKIQKSYESQAVELKNELSARDEEIVRLQNEIEELKYLFTSEDEEEEKVEEEIITEDEFKTYLEDHRVLMWGFRDNIERRYMKQYPELSFIGSDKRLTRKQLDAYDVLIMCTSYTNHARFFAARDTAKRSGIKMAYLSKYANDPVCLRNALAIALGQQRKNENGTTGESE